MMMNLKVFGRKRPWPDFKVQSRHSPGGTEENHGHRDRKSNPAPPEYEVGVLTTRPRRSVCHRGIFTECKVARKARGNSAYPGTY
jgi:hypothetical protein